MLYDCTIRQWLPTDMVGEAAYRFVDRVRGSRPDVRGR